MKQEALVRLIAGMAIGSLVFSGCGPGTSSAPGLDPSEAAAGDMAAGEEGADPGGEQGEEQTGGADGQPPGPAVPAGESGDAAEEAGAPAPAQASDGGSPDSPTGPPTAGSADNSPAGETAAGAPGDGAAGGAGGAGGTAGNAGADTAPGIPGEQGTAGGSAADGVVNVRWPGPEPPAQPPQRRHVDVRGLYMSGWIAGSSHFYELVDFMQAKGLNAVVIDVKDDDGRLSWPMEIPLATEIGANITKVADIEGRLRYLKERDIYTIARIVVYADPLLGSQRPDLAIRNPDGTLFVDSRQISWPSPYEEEVWAYNVAVAKEAAAAGFDEIQFDYIRFPEHRIPGYNAEVPVRQRVDAVLGFLRYAREELEPWGVFVAADVFGLTTSVAPGDDMGIGQIYEEIAQVVDYILPMVYPSHYAQGTYGIPDPNQAPGRIVYESMVRAQKRTWGMPVEKHRPWIQDFDVGKDYTAADIEAQIRGLAEAGIYQWILWDPRNRYTRDVNYDVAPPTGEEPAWRKAYRAGTDPGAAAAPAPEPVPSATEDNGTGAPAPEPAPAGENASTRVPTPAPEPPAAADGIGVPAPVHEPPAADESTAAPTPEPEPPADGGDDPGPPETESAPADGGAAAPDPESTTQGSPLSREGA